MWIWQRSISSLASPKALIKSLVLFPCVLHTLRSPPTSTRSSFNKELSSVAEPKSSSRTCSFSRLPRQRPLMRPEWSAVCLILT